MAELPLILMNGFLGSSHCIGMCGGFALTIGLRTERISANLRRQLVYSVGRLMTYVFLGAVAGGVGRRLSDRTVPLVSLQALLAVAAGVLLIWQGARAAGWRWPGGRVGRSAAPCLSGGILKTYLTASDLTSMFLAGLMTGFLPCGLVYAHLALASATGHLGPGMATMAMFGLGTVPLMVAAGLGGGWLSLSMRQRLLKVAAYCVMLTGALSLYRGVASAARTTEDGPAACPFCAERP